jgi:hypothetical protein
MQRGSDRPIAGVPANRGQDVCAPSEVIRNLPESSGVFRTELATPASRGLTQGKRITDLTEDFFR